MLPLRALARYPAYLATSLATVTLAVGANLVVFSFINALWLKPRAVDLDRVVVVGTDFDIPDGSRYSERALDDFRRAGAFESVAGQVVTGFGFVTLVLALVSVFGLVAHVIESRWREFAVRMALGATRGSIATRALWISLEPVAMGGVGGMAAAAALSGTIQAYLYGLSAVEPASYAGVCLALIAGAFVAAAIAGRRILSVSVADSLRQE